MPTPEKTSPENNFAFDNLSASDKRNLRRELRARRRALTHNQQKRAAMRMAIRVADRPEFVRAASIAVYLAADGEIDTHMLIDMAWQRGKRVYLPILQPGNRLRFAEFRAGDDLIDNRLGIPEPRIKRFRAAKHLDLVLMPLVGFDAEGGRLGMGGGFYDRTFAFLKESGKRRPLLVGLAHECQCVDSLPAEPWDVRLHAVATDRRWREFQELRP